MNNSKMEWQFCTKEQSLRLVELGVKWDALFWHMPAKDGPHGEYIQYGYSSEAIAPAYGVAELGEALPEFIGGHRLVTWSPTEQTLDGERKTAHAIQYRLGIGTSTGALNDIIFSSTEAIARAAMLIYLLENNLMELPPHWRQDPNSPCADGRCHLSYSPDMRVIQPLPTFTDGEMETPAAQALLSLLKDCTITMPRFYTGYRGVTGGHVKLILEALNESK